MDFNQVVVFAKVVQAGSFSAAARLLGLPTSTVSHRVAMLEKRLGVTLLQRTTRRLHLTDTGQIYYDHASAGLVHVLDAEAAVTEAREEPCGLLRITAPVDIGNQILSSILGQMRSQWPKVDVELVLMNRYVDLVAEGVDVAIRTGPLKDSTLIAKQVGIARCALRPVCQPGLPRQRRGARCTSGAAAACLPAVHATGQGGLGTSRRGRQQCDRLCGPADTDQRCRLDHDHGAGWRWGGTVALLPVSPGLRRGETGACPARMAWQGGSHPYRLSQAALHGSQIARLRGSCHADPASMARMTGRRGGNGGQPHK